MNISKANFRFVPFLNYTKKSGARMICLKDIIAQKTKKEMITSLIRPMEYVVHE